MQLLKSNSSKWLTKEVPDQKDFAWQEGYAAFSIGIAQIETTQRYIANQKNITPNTASRMNTWPSCFLKKHGIQYDPRFVWG